MFVFLLPSFFAESSETGKRKILHLTFHRGCALEFEGVAKELDLNLTTWFIQDLPRGFFEGSDVGNAVYNIGHDRAERIWNLHRDFFESFDGVIVSDTAPLSRIFLQNGWKKPLVIWICNRFDYCDHNSLDCEFPDREYYELFDRATHEKNVKIVAYTEFEHFYAKSRGIDTGDLTITPCGAYVPLLTDSGIPENIKKESCFFLPPYHNETIFMDLSKKCFELGISNYCGRYNGAADLVDFKGIVHLPYAWSNLALFENMLLGIPYFIPSEKFLRELRKKGGYFLFANNPHLYEMSEWYSLAHADVITYFDSWEDLQEKVETTDYPALREKIKAHAIEYKERMLSKWIEVFIDF